jgi:hypothetical protein
MPAVADPHHPIPPPLLPFIQHPFFKKLWVIKVINQCSNTAMAKSKTITTPKGHHENQQT